MSDVEIAQARILRYLREKGAMDSPDKGLNSTAVEIGCAAENRKAGEVYVDDRAVHFALEELQIDNRIGRDWVDTQNGGEYRYYLKMR